MPTLAAIRLWFRALVSPRAVERDLDRELRFHLEMEEEKHRRAGSSPDEARRRAMVAFGGMQQFKDAVRDERGVHFRDELAADVRYALRQLRRTPAFSALAVLVLALGIGSATAVATVVEHVLRRSLPYPGADRIVFLTEAAQNGDAMLTSFPNFDDWRRRSRTLSQVAAFTPVVVEPLVIGGDASRGKTQTISRGFFELFGVRPVAGRFFLPDEYGKSAARVAIVSEQLWRSQLAARPLDGSAMVKRGGASYAIVGVMPKAFEVLEHSDVWIPGEAGAVQVRGAGNYWVAAQLAPRMGLSDARKELGALAAQLKSEYGEASISSAVVVTPLLDRMTQRVRRPLLILLGCAVFVLLVTAASIGMMQLARSSSRDRELGIRTALGAGRLRLVRQLATEQCILAAIGCLGGTFVAAIATAAVRQYGVNIVPRIEEVQVDALMLAFAITASVITVVIFGFAPVFRLLRRPLVATAESLRSGTTKSRVGWTPVIGIQAAVSIILLIGAALLVRTIQHVLTSDMGYTHRGLVAVSVPLTSSRYNALDMRVRAAGEMMTSLGSIPGVTGVALSSQLPIHRSGNRGPILISPFANPEAQASWASIAALRVVTPNYFDVMSIPLLRGRVFAESDGSASKGVIINHALAQKLWPGQDPMGKELRALSDPRHDTLTVIGEVADAHDWRSAAGEQQELFLTIAQRPQSAWQLNAVLRTNGSPTPILAESRRRIRDIDAEMAPLIRTLDDAIAESIGDQQLVGRVIVIFAVIVLALTAAGVGGSVSYSVQQRTRELGVRMALGATPADVWLLVQRSILLSAAAGGIVGIIIALQATQLLSSLLFGVTPRDPLAIAFAAGVVAVCVGISTFIPALRAARMDPIKAMRSE